MGWLYLLVLAVGMVGTVALGEWVHKKYNVGYGWIALVLFIAEQVVAVEFVYPAIFFLGAALFNRKK